MKASKFSDAQKALTLKQGADGVPMADTGRKAGISQAAYLNWKKKYHGMLPPDMRRLKQLEDENSKVRKLGADLSLDKQMRQDVMATAASTFLRREGELGCSSATRRPKRRVKAKLRGAAVRSPGSMVFGPWSYRPSGVASGPSMTSSQRDRSCVS
jgi:putative transposase